MSELIDLEKKLLDNNSVCKSDLKHELMSDLGDNYNEGEDNDADDSFDNQSNDIFKKYIELVRLFGNKVFVHDKDAETIMFNKNFQAKQEYRLCLACMEAIKKQNTRKTMSGLFEECSAEAIKAYLGKNTQYKLIDNAQKQTMDFEKFCSEELSEKNLPNANENFKDDEQIPRCDIIVWQPLDNMSSKIILLVQCKMGKNWINGKGVNVPVWERKLIDFANQPVKVFAITDLITKNKIFIDKGRELGLIFDRARIIRLLATTETNEIQKIRDKITEVLGKSL